MRPRPGRAPGPAAISPPTDDKLDNEPLLTSGAGDEPAPDYEPHSGEKTSALGKE